MSRLVYSALASLDGYVNDADGGFAWAAPDPEVHAFVNERERGIGTYLYGRRMYETMSAWETVDGPDVSPVEQEYAEIWRRADKIVFSTTLAEPTTSRTRLVRRFDAAGVRDLKESATADLSIGGPELAGHALAAGLVDDVWLFVQPVVVGGGQSVFAAGLRLDLELVAEGRIGSTAYLHYRVGGG